MASSALEGTQRLVVTSPLALWQRLCRLADGQPLTLALCVEAGGRGAGGRRRRPTQERWIMALRLGSRIFVFDAAAAGGPRREIRGGDDLSPYFDDVAGFSYVEVCG